MAGALVIAAVVAVLLLAAPVVAIIALLRVRRLERRLAGLEARATLPSEPLPLAVAPPPAEPLPVATAVLPPLPDLAPPPPDARRPFDWETVIAGRWLHRIGLIAVAVGVSYFLKYAIDNDWIGPRGQVAIGALLGAALVAWSTRFVSRGLSYFADGLASLGSAVLYLSLWASTAYYAMLSSATAFAAMVFVTAAMLAIAIGRRSQRLAVMGLIGGFLTPWLVSTGRDAQVELFSYLALHNAALLAIGRARDWRWLALPALAFTQAYFWGWFDRFYAPAALGRTVAFAALFFGQFSAVPILRIRRGVLTHEHAVLVLVNAAAVGLALRATLWDEHRWWLTMAMLALSAWHIVVARGIPAATPSEAPVRLLFAGVAITCAFLAVAARLSGYWITLAWAVQAGVLAWTGWAVGSRFARGAAYAIFAAVALRLLAVPLDAATFLWNARLVTTAVIAASALVTVWRGLTAAVDSRERAVLGTLAVAANLLVLWTLTAEVDLYFGASVGQFALPAQDRLARSLAISLLWTAYASVLVGLGVRLGSARVRWQGLALFAATTVKVFFLDLGYLSGFYRIASTVALGVVLLVVSLVYQRSVARRLEHEEAR